MEYLYTDLQINPNLDQIHREVALSSMSDKGLLHCTWNNNKLSVNFNNSLSQSDKSLLDTIIYGANGSNNSYYFKINNSAVTPINYNINHFGLHKEEIINSLGLLVEVNYYKNYDGVTYSDLVVKDSYNYVINSSDLVETRTEVITWYLNNGDEGATKVIQKYYDLKDAIKEGMRRRTNLIDSAKAYGLSHIAGTHASGIPNSHYFFDLLSDNVDKYIKGVLKDNLINQISSTTEPYISQEIKDNLVNILQYWAV